MQTINATDNTEAIVADAMSDFDAKWAAVSAQWTDEVKAEMGNSFPARELALV